MAFLGSFGKFIDRTVHNPIVQAIFPVAAVASLVGKGVVHGLVNTAEKVLAGHPGQHQEQSQIIGPGYAPYQPNGQFSVMPSGFSDYGQGGGYAPPYYQNPEPSYNYEVPPWDYSTFSAQMTPTRSIPQALPVAYYPSQSQTSGTVEDLLAAALPLLLL